MSNRWNVAIRTSNLVGVIAKYGGQFLNTETLALENYDSDNYTLYINEGARDGSSLNVSGTLPTGAPAKTYDLVPVEAVGSDGAGLGGFAEENDQSAGGIFQMSFNGAELSEDLGTDVDPAVALVSLDEQKQYSKVTDDDSDAILASLINSCSEMIVGEIGRRLLSKEHTEYYNGDGSDCLILQHRPVVSIASIHSDSEREWGDDYEVEAENYQLDKATGIVRAWNLFGNWPGGYSNIRAIYTAGYTAGSSGTMPHDIRLAVKRLVDHQWRDGFTQRKLDVSSDVVGDANRSYREAAIPKDVEKILDRYRNYMPSPNFDYAD